MAAKVAQYVTIIDRSNKVVGSSRQFKDVFREAKEAYQGRKAEIRAQKKVKEEVELQKAIRAVTLQEESERGSTIRPDTARRRSSQRNHEPGRRSPPENARPRTQRIHTNGSTAASGTATPQEGVPRQMNLADFNEQIYGPNGAATQARRASRPSPVERWEEPDTSARGLVRAQTDLPLQQARIHPELQRSQSADEIDMDLAYGEYHPESLVILPEEQKEKELKSLVTKCKMLLEEADCAGHSAKAIIAHLQKNPDTLAAVGLTLAEISSIAKTMAPGAVAAISKSAPAVMALLMSPQFLIAVGVSVGVTVIALGGYKIVKRIQANAAGDTDRHIGPGIDEAIDVRELDRIERWRRGIPESTVVDDQGSVISGTSVEGEFITPFAAQSMGHLPPKSSAGKSKSAKKSKDKDKDRAKGEPKKHRRRRSDGDTSSVASKETSSTARRSSATKTHDRSVVKVKKPSPLTRMFTSPSIRS